MSSTIIYLKALKSLISMPPMSLNSFFQANKISPVTRLQEMGSESSTGKDPLPIFSWLVPSSYSDLSSRSTNSELPP